MKFEAMSGNIKGLFTSTRTYRIPRFQRDFSWEKSHYVELFDDLMDQISIKDNEEPKNQFENSQYFLGNMLFFGEKDKDQVDVVDGQQRLTTTTILLAAIRNSLYNVYENSEYSEEEQTDAKNYAETIQNEYLIKKIDGKAKKKLKTSSSYPYFTLKIQEYNEEAVIHQASNEEEEGIEEAFKIFLEQLEAKKLLKKFKDKLNSEPERAKAINIQNETHYVPALKALRDQLLESEIIEVYVGDEEQANRIFENINSKGKPLSEVDLIKNAIFSKVGKTEGGVDTAHDLWKEFGRKIQEVNKTGDTDINFNEFFLHYWKGRFPEDRATGKNLYRKYTELYGNKSESENKKFIEELDKGLDYYLHIVSPDANKFKKKHEKAEYDYLIAINKFRGIQVRPAILAYYLKENEMSEKIKTSTTSRIEFLEMLSNFHFLSFGSTLNISSNKVTAPYQDFAKSLQKVSDNHDLKTEVGKLSQVLFKDISESSINKVFEKMEYSKKNNTRKDIGFSVFYVLNQIANKLDKRTYLNSDSTIEHIIDESEGKVNNIGNLTILEDKYNQKLAQEKQEKLKNKEDFDYSTKKEVYKDSSYQMTKDLVKEYKTFDEDDIPKRAEKLASLFWELSLEKYKKK